MCLLMSFVEADSTTASKVNPHRRCHEYPKETAEMGFDRGACAKSVERRGEGGSLAEFGFPV